ncbi:MAG: thiamine biosynthesis lipoprotein [Planctomycetota bacterium]|jgi:thiamine biosynthesis lipoprotein
MNLLATSILLLAAPTTGVTTAPIAANHVHVTEQAETIHRQVTMMGTSLTIEVEHGTRALALAASEVAIQAVEVTEARLSTWKTDSELSLFNRSPLGSQISLSPELTKELSRAIELWNRTEGAFDPAIGALIEAWALRTNGRVPTSPERQASLLPGGIGSLRWSSSKALASNLLQGQIATRHHANLRIDAGAFGKGAALDQAIDALRAAGVKSAKLDFGGQIAVFGRAATVSIADPRDRRTAVLSLRLETGSLATSGNSERSVLIDGVRYGHLLDPRTGSPAPDFGTATVIAPDAFTADALSTGFFVLGPERALKIAEQLQDVELLILDTRGPELRVLTTSGLRDKLIDQSSTSTNSASTGRFPSVH